MEERKFQGASSHGTLQSSADKHVKHTYISRFRLYSKIFQNYLYVFSLITGVVADLRGLPRAGNTCLHIVRNFCRIVYWARTMAKFFTFTEYYVLMIVAAVI